MAERAEAACGGVLVADARDAAARGGLRAGDRIVDLNGGVPLDVLDLEDAAADGTLWLSVLRDGHPLDLVVTPGPGEWHGISLDHGGLGDEPHTCRNACRFCFVDQVPAGLRGALSVKDDDYRLSFLHGNFMTLTNLREPELERIEELRLSPLYVSLHAWDDAARVRLMGRAAAGSREVLERLAEAGLVLHLQIVLCPGWNDGDVLAETVLRAGELDSVADLGVVPVSLAAEGDLRRVTPEDARGVIAAVEGWQREFLRRRGTAFVHAADEFYLLAGAEPPAGDALEQYENGVGIAAATIAEAETLAAAWTGAGRSSDAPARAASRRHRRAPAVRHARAAGAREGRDDPGAGRGRGGAAAGRGERRLRPARHRHRAARRRRSAGRAASRPARRGRVAPGAAGVAPGRPRPHARRRHGGGACGRLRRPFRRRRILGRRVC